uniref:Gamma-tubulin complex component n=1 Tax=Parascaris univalens TaxID=6257 RepID=A0A915C098_PARUN
MLECTIEGEGMEAVGTSEGYLSRPIFPQHRVIPSKTSIVMPLFKTLREQRHLGCFEAVLKEREAKHSGGFIEWTEAELINPILSIIEINKKCPFLITKQDGSFDVDSRHHLRGNAASSQSIAVYVAPFLEAHRQLTALVAFTERKDINSKIAEVLQEFVISFLSEHALSVSRRYTDKSLCAQMLAYSLRDELRALSAVHDALSTVFDVEVWTSETVDKFIERFLRLVLFAELQPHLTRNVVRRLQEVVFSVMKRYFDTIFSEGSVEETFANEFVFYDVKEDGASDSLGIRATACSLWSPQLIRSVLAGARDARRLRSNGYTKAPSRFSTYFMQYLHTNDSIGFVKASDIISSVERAAACCATDNAKHLFSFARDNALLETSLREIESIFTGFAVRELAFDLFGATRESPVSNIVLSFYNSLLMSGFTEERCCRWNISCGNGTLEQLRIFPNLQWPVEYVVDDRFIETANRCVRFLLRLMRAKETLSRIHIKYDKMDRLPFTRRKLHLLVASTTQPLTTMAELLFIHLQSLMAKKMPLILESSTIDEAHERLMSLNSQLDHLVSEKGCARALVHNAVSRLCELADELDTRLANDLLKDADLDELLKVVLREKELLIGLGKAMQGTIFNALQLFLS